MGQGFGIFDGAGVEEHYEVKSHPPTSEGATFEVTCDRCGNRQMITIEWQQIADAARVQQSGKLPVDPVTRMSWIYDAASRRMYPQIGCPNCRGLVGPSITPDEAARLLREAMMAGVVQSR